MAVTNHYCRVDSERIQKIRQYLAKLRTRVQHLAFLTHIVVWYHCFSSDVPV